MGDLEGWKGNLLEEECPPSAHPVCHAIDICIEQWTKAELRTKDIISHIQPTIDSENQRNAVVEYVQHLVCQCIGCEVIAFGSVPLKTYLPDGDIDLTAFSEHHAVNNTWASDVRSVLQEEEKRVDAEFRVKEVQYIHAEVKLVKCLIENIVVDISFNQLGGLSTLCFLEQVNGLIGKDNLFKRSIILVKAWCYYESRILGAHHGLISTYALETLVLYIFHIFHATVRGPLEVLYKFLDFFSKFDWDNYCLSIQGPVPKSALPEIAAESPRTNGGNVMFSKEFLKECSENYCLFPKDQDNHIQTLSAKHLNIVDPLRENNNLGRSVSKANFHRIRSALAYGARILANILQSPEEKISGELDKFFMNTRERHGCGWRPDVPELKSQGATNKPSVKSESSMVFLRSINDNCMQDGKKNALTTHSTTDIKILENKSVDTSAEDVSSTILDDLPVLDNRIDHITEKKIEQCSKTDVSAINQFNDNCNNKTSPPLEDLISGDSLACNFQKHASDKYSGSLAGPHLHFNPFGEPASESPNPHEHDTLYLVPRGHMSVGGVDGLSSSKSDLLNGDYRHHLNSLAYGRSCQDHVWPCPVVPRYVREHCLWEGPGRPLHSNMCMPNHVRGQGVVSSHPFHYPSAYPGANSQIQSGTYNNEEITKPRSGTGTYFPKIYHSNGEKQLANKGRQQYGIPASDYTAREGHGHHSSRHYARNDSVPSWEFGCSNFEGNTSDENYGIGGLSRPESLYKSSYQSTSQAVIRNSVLVSPGGGMTLPMHPPSYLSGQNASPSFTTINTSGPPILMTYPYSSRMPFPSDHVQFGTFGPVPFCTVPCVRPEPGGSVKEMGLQQSAAPLKQDRLASRNYQLKEEDFPPLSFQGTDRGDFSGTGSEHSSN